MSNEKSVTVQKNQKPKNLKLLQKSNSKNNRSNWWFYWGEIADKVTVID